jgi:hypothetical protein
LVLIAGLVTAAAVAASREPQVWPELWLVAIPGILTGVGTLCLAALTLFLAHRQDLAQRQLLDRQVAIERRMAEARDVERREAAKFRAIQDSKGVRIVTNADENRYRVGVQNASDASIFDVELKSADVQVTIGGDVKSLQMRKFLAVRVQIASHVRSGSDSELLSNEIAEGDRTGTRGFVGPTLLGGPTRINPIATVSWVDRDGFGFERAGSALPSLTVDPTVSNTDRSDA